MRVALDVNGSRYEAEAEPRTLLSDFLRHELGLTGTNVGCEHGVCGACTVQLDGEAVRSCLMLAVQVDSHEVTTVEGLPWGPLQEAFQKAHALQCGFCTPGIAITLSALTAGGRTPGEQELTAAMSGHICRCTGYQGIRRAIRSLAGEGVGGQS